MAQSVALDDRGLRRRRDRSRVLPVQALLPRLRARHHDRDVVRRRHHRADLHVLDLRLPRHHQPRDPGQGQAGLEGRLADALGLRARRLRARGDGPRHARVVVHRGTRAGRVGCGATRGRRGSATASSGSPGVQKMSSSAGGAPTAADALRTLEPGILRWLYVRRQPKQNLDIDFGPEVVRGYDEWDALFAQRGRPVEAGRAGARLRARVGDADRGAAARARGRRTVPNPGVGGRRDRRLGRPDQPDHVPPRPHPRLGRPARAAAVAGDGMDGGVRAGRRPHHGPRPGPTGRRWRRCRAREREWVSLLLQGLARGEPRARGR